MNWEQIEGSWKEIKGKARERWGRLTHDELDMINGRREQLEGTLERVYGKTSDEAKHEVEEFCKSVERSDQRDRD